MWFLLLSSGAVVVQLGGAALARRLPAPPPAEALLALWFLLAVFVRLAVMRYRLAAFQRKARRLARRAADGTGGNDSLKHLGMGVGMGALQAVGGDLIGASLSLLSGLVRGVASAPKPQPTPQRERRRAARAEAVKTVSCVTGVGLVCVALAWWPLVGKEAERLGHEAASAAGFTGAELRPTPSPQPPRLRPVSAAPAAPAPPPAAGPGRPASRPSGERHGPPSE